MSSGLAMQSGMTLRIGSRAIIASKDPYVRNYPVNPVVTFLAGDLPGHLEIVILRRWRILLSRAI